MTAQASAPAKAGQQFFARGWAMIFFAFILSVVTQGFGIYHFSMLKTSITETIGATSTEVAFAYSFYALSMAAAGLVAGGLINKIGLRKVLLVSAVLFGGGFLILSATASLPMLYATYIIMGAGSSLGGVVIITGIPANWFVKHRGIANGIIWSATFVGSLFVTNFIAAVTAATQWQDAARWLGAIAFVVIIAVSLFLKWRPQDIGLLPDGMRPEEAAAEYESAGSAKIAGLTRSQALKTRTFWVFAGAIFLTGIGEMGVLQNTATYIVSLGNPLSVAAMFMSLIGFIGFICKILGGSAIDKFGGKPTYIVIEVIAAAGLLMMAFATPESSMAYMYVAIALFGIGENAAIVCFSACTGKFLGIKNYAQIFAVVFLAKAAGDAVGSPLIAAMADSAMGWGGAFEVAAVACIVSAVIFVFSRKEEALVELEKEAAAEMLVEQRAAA